MEGDEKIDDQYNFEQTQIEGELDSDEEDEENDAPDFLKVDKLEEEEVDEEIDTDLKGNIRIHGEEEEDIALKIPGATSKDGAKPMIQEISSTKAGTKKAAAAKRAQAKAEKPKPVFSWEKAERVDSEFTFMN